MKKNLSEILSTHKHIMVSRMLVNLHNICMKMPWKETHGSYHKQHFVSTRREPDHSCYAMSNPRSCNCVFNMQSATSGTVVVHPSDWMRIWGQIYSTNIFFRPREVKRVLDSKFFPGTKYFKEWAVCHKGDKETSDLLVQKWSWLTCLFPISFYLYGEPSTTSWGRDSHAVDTQSKVRCPMFDISFKCVDHITSNKTQENPSCNNYCN